MSFYGLRSSVFIVDSQKIFIDRVKAIEKEGKKPSQQRKQNDNNHQDIWETSLS